MELLTLNGEGIQIGDIAAEELALLAGQPAISVRLNTDGTRLACGVSKY